MARFLALEFIRNNKLGYGTASVVTLLGVMAFSGAALHAQSMAQPAPAVTAPASAKPNPATTKPTSPAPATAANAKPTAPPTPPPVPETFNRYGKIWAPTDDVLHPIRLNVQFPGVGDLKVPSQEELSVRDKLEKLAVLSDDQIRAELAQWPPYAKMKLADEGQLLMRIQQFKDQRTRVAMDKAKELGLFNSFTTPEQKARFEKTYWDKKLQMDRDLAKEFEPAMKAREQKLRDDLLHEFSPPAVVPPPAPIAQVKPGTAAPPVVIPPAPAPAKPNVIPPIAQGKTAPDAAPPVVH